MKELHHDIASLCLNAYNRLGRKGKPQQGKEWTKMAAIVQTDPHETVKVISLATGTKCIGEADRSSNGYLLNDSHAEILARRLLLRYLYYEITNVNRYGIPSIFTKENSFYRLKDGYKFHLFTTDLPCGDACIYPKELCTLKRKYVICRDEETPSKCPKLDSSELDFSGHHNDLESRDINRTGAKCVPLGEQDLLIPGESYHAIGALRIKPGRGNRTISMSCSDKIMKWCSLGIQGGLLSNLIKKPLFLSTVVINNSLFSHDAVRRAFSFRGRNALGLEMVCPEIYQTDFTFVDSKETLKLKLEKDFDNITASSMSLLWCPSCGIHEVSNNGKKHGLTKKDFNTIKARTAVCKHVLFEEFKSNKNENRTYHECKGLREEYQTRKLKFFQVFYDWVKKPHDLESFT